MVLENLRCQSSPDRLASSWCLAAAEELLQLYLEMKSWVGVPRTVRNALTPEPTMRHAEKMLPKDSRLRIFWPKDSHHGAMYLCHQGHVDLADSSTGGMSFPASACCTLTARLSCQLRLLQLVEVQLGYL